MGNIFVVGYHNTCCSTIHIDNGSPISSLWLYMGTQLKHSRRCRRQRRTKANRTPHDIVSRDLSSGCIEVHQQTAMCVRKGRRIYNTSRIPTDGRLWIYAPVAFDEVEKPTSWPLYAWPSYIIVCIVTARVICVPYQRDARVTSSRRRRSSTMMFLRLLYIYYCTGTRVYTGQRT